MLFKLAFKIRQQRTWNPKHQKLFKLLKNQSIIFITIRKFLYESPKNGEYGNGKSGFNSTREIYDNLIN